ncbi:hypothetical protein [Streptomyces sp. AC495_CC817]|uniref:hypothetical protein n=1 Tax=Streptomyces sp. AC495_CC817 TaxID=2823900 RepID=UPI001C27F19C|nr:hypothetical protein [Streptomyces sp. AC495_CC817]
MSTNSLTLADALNIAPERRGGLTVAEVLTGGADGARYAEALREGARAVLDGYDTVAAYAYETARRIAHVAVDHGNYDPILDQLERAYA